MDITGESYARSVAAQIEQYRKVDNIHLLPEIFHYWSNRYIRPRLNEVFGVDSITDFYVKPFKRACMSTSETARFASLGSGDASLEIEISSRLIELGCKKFTIECFELSPVLTERAQNQIEARGLKDIVHPIVSDLNEWRAETGCYDGVMAHHSLHHLCKLEEIFNSVKYSLKSGAVFVTNDMIGRNGHMRWPETLSYIENIWAFMPEIYKYNHQLCRFESRFINHDCSGEGFEGIRAQDVLPLLVKEFHFQAFLGFGGVIDIFADRSFGHNFVASDPSDCAFIDLVQSLNDVLLRHGEIKPTIMFAVLGCEEVDTRFWETCSPKHSIRGVSGD